MLIISHLKIFQVLVHLQIQCIGYFYIFFAISYNFAVLELFFIANDDHCIGLFSHSLVSFWRRYVVFANAVKQLCFRAFFLYDSVNAVKQLSLIVVCATTSTFSAHGSASAAFTSGTTHAFLLPSRKFPVPSGWSASPYNDNPFIMIPRLFHAFVYSLNKGQVRSNTDLSFSSSS